MKGRMLSGGLVLFTAAFAIALWYFQTRAYYHDVTGVTQVAISGVDVPVQNYRGIDADTSPLKMRACFVLEGDAPVAGYEGKATPLVGPSNFSCFDAAKIQQDLADGNAIAVLGDSNVPYGFDRVLAIYPDKTAFMWREINICGSAIFAGDPLPEGCPPKPEVK